MELIVFREHERESADLVGDEPELLALVRARTPAVPVRRDLRMARIATMSGSSAFGISITGRGSNAAFSPTKHSNTARVTRFTGPTR